MVTVVCVTVVTVVAVVTVVVVVGQVPHVAGHASLTMSAALSPEQKSARAAQDSTSFTPSHVLSATVQVWQRYGQVSLIIEIEQKLPIPSHPSGSASGQS